MKQSILLLFCLMFGLAACSDPNDNQEINDPAAESDNGPAKEVPTIDQPEYAYPLTGVEAEAEVTDRVIAVMVNNHSDARPQTGLSQADIIFEILSEGNITRFMALYQSDIPEQVGPVRSARPYYVDLAQKYDAIYIYHGAANFIEDMIQAEATESLNGMYYDNDHVLFERSTDREAPHNSYVWFDGIYQYAEDQGFPLEANYTSLPFLYGGGSINGEDGSEISYAYDSTNQIRYQYDTELEQYYRYSDGEQTVEYEDQQPVTLDNVFFVEAEHQVMDKEGRREIDLESGGDALLLQRGKVQHVQWEQNDGKIVPTKDGEPVPFIPGQTWINIIPTDKGIDQVKWTP
ncbi:DUF3048 domain-containing protein [Gracilibacillus alcaliphilus]|uniref:DUF3048 domain-containing protein n=1 Tax=Gracilibacillus alcaliphilus TaxID=1401441 RepID=UPI00195BAD6A|nr:DUF3048 domain-containing protein [Gracilibacillus alcaliphilus]MBM7676087.1 hypothetical protein [Gracilibacillus alcaliphilus]